MKNGQQDCKKYCLVASEVAKSVYGRWSTESQRKKNNIKKRQKEETEEQHEEDTTTTPGKSTCAYVVVWVGGLEVWELMIL